MSSTKLDLVKLVARGLNALVTDSTFGTVVDASVFGDKTLQFRQAEQLQGKQIYAYGAPTFTPISALIDVFVPGAVPTVHVVPSFSLIPTTTRSYLILDYYKIDEIQSAVEQAIKAAGKYYFPPAIATLAVVGTQYQYTIPSGFTYIHDMHFVPTAGTDFHTDIAAFAIPRQWWTVENKKIVFNPEEVYLNDWDKEWLEIRGQARPALLSADNSAYDDILEEYLVAHAIENLAWRRMDESDLWRQKYYMAKDNRREEQDLISTGVAANAVRVDN